MRESQSIHKWPYRERPSSPSNYPVPGSPDPILDRLLTEQLEMQRTVGRMEGQMDNLSEQGNRLERSMANMGQRLESKMDEIRREMRTDQDGRPCAEHDSRLSTLEHDKSMIQGMSAPVKWVIGIVLAVLGLVGTHLISSWLDKLLTSLGG